MPRSIDGHEPRRRRGRKAAKPSTAAKRERGAMMRLLLHSPRDTAAGALALAAVLAVIVNAMFMQHGRHPSPMFGAHVVVLPPPTAAPAVRSVPATEPAPAGPLPRPRPAGADRRSDATPATPPAARHAADPIGHLVRMVSAHDGDTTPVAAPSARVAAVQRALSDYGYGQLKPTGQLGAETRAAIRKFELARDLPVTGQFSERLVRELAATTGRRFD